MTRQGCLQQKNKKPQKGVQKNDAMFFSTPLCFFEDSDIITVWAVGLQKILQENLQWKTAAKNYSTKKTGGKSMNCQTAESMVNRYIEHDLSVNELEDFLDHVENCPSCYDELETYFIVHAAMRQLDEESGDSSLDLRELLEDDIRRSKHYILKMKFRRALSGVGFCTLIAGLGGFLIYIIMQTL